MQSSSPSINLMALDYSAIRDDINGFMRYRSDFQGYDFAGANLQPLVRGLAYAGMNGAYLAQVGLNEANLSTSSTRRGIGRNVKYSGYCPRSPRAARGVVRLQVQANVVTSIPAGTKLSLSPDGRRWVAFTTMSAFTAGPTAGVVDVPVAEGSWNSVSYTVPATANSEQAQMLLRLEIPSKSVDTSTLSVVARDSLANPYRFSLVDNVVNPVPDGLAYRVEENDNQYFEIVLDQYNQPTSTTAIPNCLTQVDVGWVDTSGAAGNGLFTGVDPAGIQFSMQTIGGVTATLVLVAQIPFGGSDLESNDSVKRTAAPMWAAQNRCVTVDDYRAMILARIQGVESVRVQGGESLVPPAWGRIVISLNYVGLGRAPQSVKDAVTALVTARGVGGVVPIFIDPDFIDLIPAVALKVSSLVMPGQDGTFVAGGVQALTAWANATLVDFGDRVWNTDVVAALSAAYGVMSTEVSWALGKTVVLRYGEAVTQMAVSMGKNRLTAGRFRSTEFAIAGYPAVTLADDGAGKVVIRHGAATIGAAGTIDYVGGSIVLNGFTPVGQSVTFFDLGLTCDSPDMDLAAGDTQILRLNVDRASFQVTRFSSR